MKILKNAHMPTRLGPPEWFTGAVLLDEIAPSVEPSRIHVLRVTFEPGARTAWHSHPFGQILHVLSGVARVQKAGEPAADVHPGQTVLIAPNERHWHGAAPGQAMVHLAVQQGTAKDTGTVWYEKVTDAEYAP